jgi:phosphate starvation-inducible PhoH-like protein
MNNGQMIRLELLTTMEAMALFGPNDLLLELLQPNTKASVTTRDGHVVIQGEQQDLEWIGPLFQVLLQLIRNGHGLSARDYRYAIDLALEGRADQLIHVYKKVIAVTHRGKPIHLKTIGQNHYVSTIRKRDIVFGIGPAGTGKTYLAVVLAVLALREGQVKRIVLSRPAVEAGENLGFLPGDLQEKVDPYLRPLYDALHDMLGPEQTAKYIERGLIEIAPLAYMRGRTLDEAFIILDEAQNTTPEQMKMVLTRLGQQAKLILTGDVTQIDLPRGKKSGLREAERILRGIPEIGFVYLTEQDVVRHPLVQKIILAYDQAKAQEEGN